MNIQEGKMKNNTELDDLISKYYDYQMNDLERINFEAKLALCKKIKKYTESSCLTYFKISNSIKFIKKRCEADAQRETDEFMRKNSSIIYFDTISFKSFDKHLRNGFLNILRNNS